MWLDRVVTNVTKTKREKKNFSHTDKNYFLSSFLIRFMVQVVMERGKKKVLPRKVLVCLKIDFSSFKLN